MDPNHSNPGAPFGLPTNSEKLGKYERIYHRRYTRAYNDSRIESNAKITLALQQHVGLHHTRKTIKRPPSMAGMYSTLGAHLRPNETLTARGA